EFHKHKLDIKWYQPIYKDRLVLYTQYVVGVMDKLRKSSYISSREYFYMGGGGLSGGEPLRGYDENSIGPYENGYYIGGRNMFKSSVELRFKVTDDPMLVYGLAFFDAGNLWKDFKEANIFDLQKGAGLGIRINVPMLGMMGLDFGYGFDYFEDFGKKADWSENLRTHFRMGTNL
nr:BamA/TamA family outer membrane protein [Candidatus Delongbacteria bacterium]